MIYSEASYFNGYAFQHIAAFHEARRLRSKLAESTRTLNRLRSMGRI